MKAAWRKIEYFVNLENMKIVDFDRQMMMKALDSLVEYAYTHGLGGRDATVIAMLKKLRVKKLLSHDNIFKRLATKLEIEVVDPIPVKP